MSVQDVHRDRSGSTIATELRAARLLLRLALLRRRIEERFLLVEATNDGDDHRPATQTLPLHVSSCTPVDDHKDDDYQRRFVNDIEFPSWNSEPVVLWQRESEAWAIQLACPHAGISLAESDIEDLTVQYPSTSGPCIVCPAHMYVFEVGTGRCLTDDVTAAARTYATVRSTHGSTHCLWLARTPRAAGSSDGVAHPGMPHMHKASNKVKPSRADGNAIQLHLVNKRLRRRFGDPD
jgi:nitrite reductase/ring-hydroxylating ferredoxin subunit